MAEEDTESTQTKFQLPSTDRLLGITAILVSLCTFIVFLYQTNLIRKRQYMSVYPYLEVSHSGINGNAYTFSIENKGIGPAIIETIKVGKNGNLENQDFVEFLNSEVEKDETINLIYANLYSGRLISEKENIDLLAANDTLLATSARLYDLLRPRRMEYEIEYSSIYGERWQVTNRSSVPEKLE